MSRFLVKAALTGVAVVAATAAQADIQIRVRGNVAYLSSHRLMRGDAMEFAAFLQQPEASRVRVVYLNSKGGNTQVAMRIGQMIRERGLDTGFDARRARCVSACTTMFVGGVNRYYVGGNGVRDGIGTRHGLGFHPSNGGQMNEGRVNEYYERMGVPGASALRYRVYSRDSVERGMGPRRMYFAGGNSALRAGVATSTYAPRGLRD